MSNEKELNFEIVNLPRKKISKKKKKKNKKKVKAINAEYIIMKKLKELQTNGGDGVPNNQTEYGYRTILKDIETLIEVGTIGYKVIKVLLGKVKLPL